MVFTSTKYSILKWKEIFTYATIWNLEDTTLSEISQSQKGKYCMIPLTWGINSSLIHKDRVKGGHQGPRERRMESWCLMGTEFQLEKIKKVLAIDSDDGSTTIWMYLLS